MKVIQEKKLNEEELTILRYVTHKKFDRLWLEGLMTRKQAYVWLARRLRIRMYQCHVSMFDEEMCKKTIALINMKLGKKVKNGDRETIQEQSTLPKV